MVKNTHGGSGHKKYARKNTDTTFKSTKLRIAEEGETYAIVTKLPGNCMFQCVSMKGINLLGHIRGKFVKKKSQNTLKAGNWVLVGVRYWEKGNVCDLLEIYTDLEKETLKSSVHENWSVLEDNDITKDFGSNKKFADDIVFQTERDEETEHWLKESANAKKTQQIKFTDSNAAATGEESEDTEDDDVINVDDI